MTNTTVDYQFFRKTHKDGRLWHGIHLIILVLLIIAGSSFAVFYSLGYQINWATRTIQQTGILVLDTGTVKLPVSISINNQLQSPSFPYHYSQVLPGEYSITIKKDGYQSWSRIVHIEPNKVVAYSHIILIQDKPIGLPASAEDGLILDQAKPIQHDIEIRQQNELWVNGSFITRTSEDIVQAQWFPDNNHLVYQAGKQLLLADPDGLSTEVLVNFSSDKLVPIAFKNNGQALLFRTSVGVQSVGLY